MRKEITHSFFESNELIDVYNEIFISIQEGVPFNERHKHLSKQALNTYTYFLRNDFDDKKIARFAEERAKMIAITNFLRSGRYLDDDQIRQLDFTPVCEKCFPIDEYYKDLIRIDSYGSIGAQEIKKQIGSISDKYSQSINLLDSKTEPPKTTEEKGIAQQMLNSILDFYGNYTPAKGKKLQRKLLKDHKIKKQDLPKQEFIEYSRTDYDLSSSPTWKKYYAKFPIFSSLAQKVVSKMQEVNLPPSLLEDMNYYDFKDILFRTTRKVGKEYARLSDSKVQQRVMTIMSYPENEQKVREYMIMKRLHKKEINERIKEMKEKGITGSLFSIHHREAVQNAGKYTKYHFVNDPENYLLVSSEMHYILHHRDSINNNFYNKILAPRGDLCLSITDILRTDFHREKYRERDKTKPRIIKEKKKETITEKAPLPDNNPKPATKTTAELKEQNKELLKKHLYFIMGSFKAKSKKRKIKAAQKDAILKYKIDYLLSRQNPYPAVKHFIDEQYSQKHFVTKAITEHSSNSFINIKNKKLER